MYGFREGRIGRARRARPNAPRGGTVLSLLTVAGLAGGAGACAALPGEGRHGALGALSPAPFVETSYVGLMELPREGVPAIGAGSAVPMPSGQPVAAAYSRRYDIPPELALEIVENAVAEGVDPDLAFRLIRVESVFKVSARGPQGALGLTQLMPGTARAVDRSLDTEREILDPDNNLRVGLRYLRRMIERYDDVRLGLLAYNRGQGAVDRALRRGQDPENGYSHKVLGTRGSNPYEGPGLIDPTGGSGG